MAKNTFAKLFNGFVVYKADEVVDLTQLEEIEGFEYSKYQIAQPDELSTIGFVPVLDLEVNDDGEVLQEEEYVHTTGQFDVLKVKQSKRKVPASEVKKLVDAKVKQARADAKERNEEFELTKDLKEFFKEESIKDLLPRCFIDEWETFVFYNRYQRNLYVVAPSHKKAETITHFIRIRLGSLPIQPLRGDKVPTTVFSDFVTQQLNDLMTLGNFVQIEDGEGVVAWKKESLYQSEAKELIENSEKVVTKLELDYDGVLTFTVDEELVFSGLKFDERVTAEKSGFSSNFFAVAGEISNATQELLKELTIEVEED